MVEHRAAERVRVARVGDLGHQHYGRGGRVQSHPLTPGHVAGGQHRSHACFAVHRRRLRVAGALCSTPCLRIGGGVSVEVCSRRPARRGKELPTVMIFFLDGTRHREFIEQQVPRKNFAHGLLLLLGVLRRCPQRGVRSVLARQ